jgi:Fe-S cluster assembly ATP-binding protein
MGRPGTTVTAGRIVVDGTDLVGRPAWERARAGLFLALQQPIEVPGVLVADVMAEVLGGDREVSGRLEAEADAIGLDRRFLDRALNVDLSGGERKRNEVVQLATLRPPFAVLDEIDSGLDVDALASVARRLERATEEWGLGIVAVTHFPRLLERLRADVVHVLVGGRLVARGGPELADELERSGYEAFRTA